MGKWLRFCFHAELAHADIFGIFRYIPFSRCIIEIVSGHFSPDQTPCTSPNRQNFTRGAGLGNSPWPLKQLKSDSCVVITVSGEDFVANTKQIGGNYRGIIHHLRGLRLGVLFATDFAWFQWGFQVQGTQFVQDIFFSFFFFFFFFFFFLFFFFFFFFLF